MTKIPPKKRKTAYRSLRAICKKLGYTVMVGPMKVDTGRLPSDNRPSNDPYFDYKKWWDR